ncbi:MAG: DUF1127 domain-containing protein [Proteobacteria bacterium]|nr:DUF1127 domain-containing protein [Pseudomonadota bacterium]MDA1023854.1 DUF1127 domain-containing protein [Pseudomonadota bacterium]
MTNATYPTGNFTVQPPFGDQDLKVADFRMGVRVKMLPALVLETLSRWQRRWEARQRIRQLDVHQLADVGLTRGDLEAEARKPFWTA